MSHIMIDLETMGLVPNAAIVSIGAVHFNEVQVFSDFHTPVNLASCVERGLVVEQSTVDWWQKQSAEARSSWQCEDAPPLGDALGAFASWLRTCGTDREIKPWGNGSDYDLVLLKSAFNAMNADPPWKFWNHRCFRTVKNLHPVGELPRQGTYHNALDDARHQVSVLQMICKVHGVKLS